jgi:hypothetical protein
METPSPKLHARPTVSSRRRGRAVQEQRFTSYLTFGGNVTICLCVFVIIYALILLVMFPLLNQEVPHDQDIQRGEVLQPVIQRAVDKVKHMPHAPGQLVAEGVAGVIKKTLRDFKDSQHLTDQHLMDAAEEEMRQARLRRAELRIQPVPAQISPVAPGKRTGFMVLGMHRSGTSMVAGLMATGMGYVTGGPLIGGKRSVWIAPSTTQMFLLYLLSVQPDPFLSRRL